MIIGRYCTKAATRGELIIFEETVGPKALVRYLVEQGVGVERVEESRVTLEDISTQMVEEDEAE